MEQFLAAFPTGKAAQRYVAGSVLALPFADGHFDLALSSHFLLSYSEQLGLAFHLQAIAELCRVAREIRLFPLLTVSGEPSPWLDEILLHVSGWGQEAQIIAVDYEFQRGGNQMLKIKCHADGDTPSA